jgi:hypothetical protein
MKVAWYEKQGPAREVSVVGDMADPMPGAGEVRIRIAAAGQKERDAEHEQVVLRQSRQYLSPTYNLTHTMQCLVRFLTDLCGCPRRIVISPVPREDPIRDECL